MAPYTINLDLLLLQYNVLICSGSICRHYKIYVLKCNFISVNIVLWSLHRAYSIYISWDVTKDRLKCNHEDSIKLFGLIMWNFLLAALCIDLRKAEFKLLVRACRCCWNHSSPPRTYTAHCFTHHFFIPCCRSPFRPIVFLCLTSTLKLTDTNRWTIFSAVFWPLTHINLPHFSTAAMDVWESVFLKDLLGFLMFPFIVWPHAHTSPSSVSLQPASVAPVCFIFFLLDLTPCTCSHFPHLTCFNPIIMTSTMTSGRDGFLPEWNLFCTALHSHVLPSESCLFG